MYGKPHWCVNVFNFNSIKWLRFSVKVGLNLMAFCHSYFNMRSCSFPIIRKDGDNVIDKPTWAFMGTESISAHRVIMEIMVLNRK